MTLGNGRRYCLSLLHMHGGKRQLYAVFLERLVDQQIEPAFHREGAARLGRHLHAQHNAIIAEFLDALHLDGLYDPWSEFRIGGELQPDLLDELARLVDIRVVADGDIELVGGPVAALILHRTKLAERDGEERSAMVAQFDRPQAEAFDRSHVLTTGDVFPHPECVIEQVKDARDDVLDDRLRAEADRHTDDARSGNQRPDLDAGRRQDHQDRHDHDDGEHHVLDDWQQGPESGLLRLDRMLAGRHRALTPACARSAP